MSNRRNRRPNRWGCKPTDDVCVEHDAALVCRHGCDAAAIHECADRSRLFLEVLGPLTPEEAAMFTR
jgi:hypothetical protein